MHYFIDGHNLIAHMDGINLSDPDDEEQLVRYLKRWMAAGRKRRVTLYFDGGLPGGAAPHLSTGSLKVVFASVGREADSLIIRRIGQVRNPPEFTVVSSDNAIGAAARRRGMPLIDSATFADMVHQEREKRRSSGGGTTMKKEPSLDENDLATWLDIFGEGRSEE
jgi:predicted RNA-binding protein with PIN domain